MRALSDGNVKLMMSVTAPDDPEKLTLTEIEGWENISGVVNTDTYKLGPTGSDTLDQKPLDVVGKINVFTTSNYDGSIEVFREYDPTTLLVDETADSAFQTLGVKGREVWLAERETAKKSKAPWAAGDEYSIYRVLTDDPQKTDAGGFIRRLIVIAVQEAYLNCKIVGAAGGSGS